MVSTAYLEIYSKLQRLVAESPDTKDLLRNILSLAYIDLKSINLSPVFISAIFLNPEKAIVKEVFADAEHLDQSFPLKSPIFDAAALIKDPIWDATLAQGKLANLDGDHKYLNPSYVHLAEIKLVLVLPVIAPDRVAGIVVYGLSAASQLDHDEQEFIQLFSNLVSIAYKLEDTENSLGSITQQVYQMNAKLHQLDHLKDDFVSVASHELRTPMTAIRSYAWMAMNRSDMVLSEKMHRYLDRILVSTERLINLVNDMLNVSRIESGRLEVKPVAFDLAALVADVMTEVGPKAAEKSLQLKVANIDLPKVFADPDKVHQILLNLIGNAMKFTPAKGEITVSFLPDGQFVDTSVHDSGVGISVEDQSRLFQKFSRLDNSYVAAATSGGTGLGLFISKALIDLMKGRIWAHSDGPGKGSTFSFSLPTATPEVLANSQNYIHRVAGEAKALEPVAI